MIEEDAEDAGNSASTPVVTVCLVVVAGGLGIWIGLSWYAVLGLVATCLGTYWYQRDGR